MSADRLNTAPFFRELKMSLYAFERERVQAGKARTDLKRSAHGREKAVMPA